MPAAKLTRNNKAKEEGMDHFYAHLKNMFESEAYSDVIVKCGTDSYNLHRVVLCNMSKWFSKACSLPMNEALSGIIELHDDEPPMAKLMLHYLYHLEYTDVVADFPPLLVNVHMYTLADKYDIPPLRNLATQKFKRLTDSFSPTCDEDTCALEAAVELIYEKTVATDRTLRDIVVDTTVKNSEKLLQDQDGGLSVMMAVIGEFARDVAFRLAKGPQAKKSEGKMDNYQCPNCKNCFAADMTGRNLWRCEWCSLCYKAYAWEASRIWRRTW